MRRGLAIFTVACASCQSIAGIQDPKLRDGAVQLFDSAPLVHSMTALILDLGLYSPTGLVTSYRGGGIQILIPKLPGPPPAETAGTTTGITPCYASRYTNGAFPVDEAQGTVNMTVTHQDATAGTPIPTCVFRAGQGYRCVSEQGTVGSLFMNANGYQFTVPGLPDGGPPSFTSADVGRSLVIYTAPNAGIVTGLVQFDPTQNSVKTSLTQTMGTTGGWYIAAGLGPVANSTYVFLNDTDHIVMTFTPLDGGFFGTSAQPLTASFPNLVSSWTPDTNGDMALRTPRLFGISAASQGNYTIGCSTCGANAGATAVFIETTDVAQTPDFPFPNAMNNKAVLTCVQAGNSVTVPGALLTVLHNSPGTTVIRVVVAQVEVFRPTPNNATSEAIFATGKGFVTIGTP